MLMRCLRRNEDTYHLINHDEYTNLGVFLGQHVTKNDNLELLLGIWIDGTIFLLFRVQDKHIGFGSGGDSVEDRDDFTSKFGLIVFTEMVAFDLDSGGLLFR